MLERLNTIVSSYIEENEIESMNDFIFIYKIINIYNSYPYEYKRLIYQKYVSIEENYNYALEFFKEINPSYASYLEQHRKSIHFVKDSSAVGSCCEIIDGKKVISILSKETIEDSYDMAHEITHYMTLEERDEDISYARNIFCEALSYFIEELQFEYYECKSIDECEINSEKNISTAYFASELLEYELNFIKVYLENGIITMDDLNNLYDESKNKNLYCDTLEDILNDNALKITNYHRIVVGLVFAYYILDQIHTNEMSLQDFFKLNDNINEYEIDDFINCLNLKCTEGYILNLDDESYKKLEKSFIKILKSRCNDDRRRLQKIK